MNFDPLGILKLLEERLGSLGRSFTTIVSLIFVVGLALVVVALAWTTAVWPLAQAITDGIEAIGDRDFGISWDAVVGALLSLAFASAGAWVFSFGTWQFLRRRLIVRERLAVQAETVAREFISEANEAVSRAIALSQELADSDKRYSASFREMEASIDAKLAEYKALGVFGPGEGE